MISHKPCLQSILSLPVDGIAMLVWRAYFCFNNVRMCVGDITKLEDSFPFTLLFMSKWETDSLQLLSLSPRLMLSHISSIILQYWLEFSRFSSQYLYVAWRTIRRRYNTYHHAIRYLQAPSPLTRTPSRSWSISLYTRLFKRTLHILKPWRALGRRLLHGGISTMD